MSLRRGTGAGSRMGRRRGDRGRGSSVSSADGDRGRGSSESSDADSDSSGGIGPLTLQRIPTGEAVTIRGDPTGQKYTRDALAKYITDARNPVIPTTGQKMSTMPATRQKTHESDAAWIGRILVPAPGN